MPFIKDGSNPLPQTDGTDGWVEVPAAPPVTGNQEMVWWNPPGWVIRDPMPAPDPLGIWKWDQNKGSWCLYGAEGLVREVDANMTAIKVENPPPTADLSSFDTVGLMAITTDQISAL
jgi:hypothetical protein